MRPLQHQEFEGTDAVQVRTCHSFASPPAAHWKPESRILNLHECPADRSHTPVEIACFGALQIGEKSAYPGRYMFFEKLPLDAEGYHKRPLHQAGHDFAEDGGMVFPLSLSLARVRCVVRVNLRAIWRAAARLRNAVDVVKTVRQFSAPNSDKRINNFTLGFCHTCLLGRFEQELRVQRLAAYITTKLA